MHPYPHQYTVRAAGGPAGNVAVTADRLPDLSTAPPAEFDGPGDQWSPETLLCAAVANCFILTFRAVARAARLEWSDLGCRVEGVLDRKDGVAQFTGYTTYATLRLSAGADLEKARPLLEKAERACLIANSLRGERHLVAEISQA